ncbi:MAG: peptidylprolyl isomerase [Myxococcota bacterium]
MRVSTSALLASLVTTLTVASAFAERRVVDRIVAVIEDEIVTLRELEEKASTYLVQLEDIPDADARERKREEILRDVLRLEIRERMIDREIEENSEKLSVTEQDIDRAVDEVLKMNKLNKDQLQAALYGQGMSWSEYRRKLRKQIERARLIQFQVQGKIEIKPEDVERRCLERKRAGRVDSNQRVCASHILLSVPRGADAGSAKVVEDKALALREQLMNGADFTELAQANSADAGAPNGDLGCFARGEMLEAFEAAAFSMSPGEISEPVRTPLGFHVIRLNSREVADQGCTDERELGTFQAELYQEQMERKMEQWVSELREKAFVEERL